MATAPEHRPANLVLRNAEGLSLSLTARGAGISGLEVPLPDGPVQTVLGYAALASYENDPYYLGSTVGRFANRIAHARFELDDQEVALAPNLDGHCVHGGPEGFSHRCWHLRADADGLGAEFLLDSPDGDQGFPGVVSAEVRYRLQDGWRVLVTHRAHCSAPTPLSLANHAYFNLSGSGTALDHELWVNADRYTPTDESLIPTGEVRDVAGTPLDLRESAVMGERVLSEPEIFRHAAGFDHNYLLNTVPGGMTLAAHLRSPVTGLSMKVFTTQPAMQVYGGQHLGAPFAPGAGVCLETQAVPDAPNQPAFPDAVLRPGEAYEHFTLLEFSQT